MMEEGRTPVERVLPDPPGSFAQWVKYPAGDAVDPESRARWFYHAHPPEQRGEREHGHFHLFLPLALFEEVEPIAEPAKDDPARVVHVAALTFDTDGLPVEWIATNQWVTEEFMMPAPAIIDRLDRLRMERAGEEEGLAQVGRWLTLALAAQRPDIETLLTARDEALAQCGPRDHAAEILARTAFAL